MNASHIKTLVVLVSTLSAVGCAGILPSSVMNLGAKSAENPLKGQPIHWSDQARNVPFEGQRACTTWPLDNELTISATNDQICVKGRIYKLQGESFPPPSNDSLGIASDGSGDSGLVAGQAGIVKAKTARKIGQCTDHGNVNSVWEEPYDDCLANKDPNSKPVLTESSTFLHVGDAKFKFAAPEQPAKTATK